VSSELERSYAHLSRDRSDDNLFRHNIAINKGRITAVSLARPMHPEWESILSPYEAFTREREKEEVFEKIRASEYDICPTRLGSLYSLSLPT
jgi:hypothetical protein